MSNVGWALIALGVALVFSFYVVLSHNRDKGRWRTFVVFEVICISLAAGLIFRGADGVHAQADLYAGLFFILTVSVWAIGTLVLGLSSVGRAKKERK